MENEEVINQESYDYESLESPIRDKYSRINNFIQREIHEEEKTQHIIPDNIKTSGSPGSHQSKSQERRTRKDRNKFLAKDQESSDPSSYFNKNDSKPKVEEENYQRIEYKDFKLDSPEKISQEDISIGNYNERKGGTFDSQEMSPETYDSQEMKLMPYDHHPFQDQQDSINFDNKVSQEEGIPQQYLERSDEKEDRTSEILLTKSLEEEKVNEEFYSFSPNKNQKVIEKKNISIDYPSFGRKTENSKDNTQNNSRISKESLKVNEDIQSEVDYHLQYIISKYDALENKEEAQYLIMELNKIRNNNDTIPNEFSQKFNDFCAKIENPQSISKMDTSQGSIQKK